MTGVVMADPRLKVARPKNGFSVLTRDHWPLYHQWRRQLPHEDTFMSPINTRLRGYRGKAF
jgi:hypothetical protein